MTSTSPIRRQRLLILIALVAGIALFTGVMFGLVQRLSERFGPQVQADLEWRALRGAQELANTADVGLAVSDAAMVKESFGAYAASSDVQALVGVDAAGQVVAQHGAFDDLPAIFAAKPGTLVARPGYLASWAPAVIEGREVGKIAVVVSTARMTEAQATLDGVSRTTLIAGVIGLVLGTLTVLFFTHAVAVRDRHLERKVEARTAELNARNRGMHLVLDNVAQGFVTIDLHGVMAAERSAIVERWFGPSAPGATFGALVAPGAPDFAAWFALGLAELRDGVMPAELCLDQLPRRFGSGGRTFDVAYSPIASDSLLLIVSDVTAEIERERTEREQREIVELFQRITADRAGFDEFVAEATELVDRLRTPADAASEKRTIHTLKGNCSIYGLRGYAALCHDVEVELGAAGPLAPEPRARLLASWAEVTARLAKLRGERRQHVLEISAPELAGLVERARAGLPGRELADALAALAHEPVATRFERLARTATELGRRLGKPELDIAIADGGVRLDADRWAGFWLAMVHAVRNAVDHGIESAGERQAAGKPPRAQLRLSASRAPSGQLVIALADDGRGIDWDAVRAKARAAGLRAETAGDLVAALFHDGMSTRDTATEVSGRGVGLGALRAAAAQLGGAIAVRSEPGAGTTFELVFGAPEPMRRTA